MNIPSHVSYQPWKNHMDWLQTLSARSSKTFVAEPVVCILPNNYNTHNQ